MSVLTLNSCRLCGRCSICRVSQPSLQHSLCGCCTMNHVRNCGYQLCEQFVRWQGSSRAVAPGALMACRTINESRAWCMSFGRCRSPQMHLNAGTVFTGSSCTFTIAWRMVPLMCCSTCWVNQPLPHRTPDCLSVSQKYSIGCDHARTD